jgi:hypothetical protein
LFKSPASAASQLTTSGNLYGINLTPKTILVDRADAYKFFEKRKAK